MKTGNSVESNYYSKQITKAFLLVSGFSRQSQNGAFRPLCVWFDSSVPCKQLVSPTPNVGVGETNCSQSNSCEYRRLTQSRSSGVIHGWPDVKNASTAPNKISRTLIIGSNANLHMNLIG